MKEELRQLWKDTFGDTDTYLDLFFNRVYKEENVLVHYKNRKLIAALHLIPYQMNLDNKTIPVSYICGVATIPEERGKGIMKSLMYEAHTLLRERGDDLAVLIPASDALFTYYEKMGYRKFFYYHERVYKEINTYKYGVLVPGKAFPEEVLFKFFNEQIHKRSNCILHDYTDFTNIITDLYLANGSIKVLLDNDCKIKALAFVYPGEENKMLIKDILSINETYKDVLLYNLQKQNPGIKMTVREPWTKDKKIPFGMAYPVNPALHTFINNHTGFMSLMLE